MTVEFANKQAVLDRFKRIPETTGMSVRDTMNALVLHLLGYIKTQKLSGQVLHRRTGQLSRSMTSLVEQDGKEIKGEVSTNIPYAFTHEFGATITPREANYLVFQVNGRWVSTKQVTIPARPFMKPSLDENRDEYIKRLRQAFAQGARGRSV
jgi:phage gpG-like protein